MLCECGCGQATRIATKTATARGVRKGEYNRFLSGHSSRMVSHRVAANGYILVFVPHHPSARPDGYMLEHRYVVELSLGRALARSEHVHHLNGIKADNRVENLVILSQSEHSRLHMLARPKKYETCTMTNCARRHEARGLCAKHYLRWVKYGDPTVFHGRWPTSKERI